MPRNLAGMLVLALVAFQPGCLFLETVGFAPKPHEDARGLPPKESVTLSMAVAESLANQGHIDEAIEQIHKARMFDPRADVSGSLARLYAQKRADREALDEFDKALRAHPNDAQLLNDLGYFEYERGNWLAAEGHLSKAVQIDPQHKRAWTNLGLALGQQSRYDESLQAFEKAVRPAEARCNLAFVLLTQGKRDQARKLYQEALQLDPGSKLARSALAKLDRPAVANKS